MNRDLKPTLNHHSSRIHAELSRGDWEEVSKSSAEWLADEPSQPAATFMQNIACLFTNPPDIIRNKHYLEKVNNKDWTAVLDWFKNFRQEADRHNPYFQAIEFIVLPASKKVNAIESALEEHPNQAELLFLQAISLRDRGKSIEKLKVAVANKPEFPAALYLLGIFSLQLNQTEDAEAYLKQAVDQAPDFLEAHYQLGSLYCQYIPNQEELMRQHFQKVIELDPQGEAGLDARRVLEENAQPQYGQHIAGDAAPRRRGMSVLTMLGISLLTVALFSGPIASLFKITSPLMGILAGIFVFIGLYSAFSGKKKG